MGTATLIAEIGTATTRLVLVDYVDQDFRLVARAETASTLRGPAADTSSAITELAAMIEQTTGRELLRDGTLLIPGPGLNGVRALVITTSAAGALPLTIMALSAQHSARVAVPAAQGVYSRVEHIFALDEGSAAGNLWLGAEMEVLTQAAPAAILVVGGYEDGAVGLLGRLAQLISLVARTVHPSPMIVYAGNSHAAPLLRAALGDNGDLVVVDNLQPYPHTNRLEPTRAALRRVYAQRQLPTMPGFATLQQFPNSQISTVSDDQGLMLRFLAERFNRNMLLLDAGAAHTSAILQADEHYSQTILSGTGVGLGAPSFLEAQVDRLPNNEEPAEAPHTALAAILRWLPWELPPAELRNRLLNRAAHHYTVPADHQDLMLDHALIREGLSAALAAMRVTRTTQYDLVIGAGALARAPQPGLAALTLLDVLALDGYAGRFAVELYLDSLDLLAASGALARLDVDAAVSLIEQDGINNGPLATAIVPIGDIQMGQAAVEVELTPSSGEAQRVEVLGGQIARLPLARGQRATLRIRPAPGIAIGDNQPGAEARSDEAAIAGSLLGVLIDARPRPLVFPTDLEERRLLFEDWLTSLDALPHGISWLPTERLPDEAAETATTDASAEQPAQPGPIRRRAKAYHIETKPQPGSIRRAKVYHIEAQPQPSPIHRRAKAYHIEQKETSQ